MAFTISGYVEDEKSGERLIGAHVFDSSHRRGTATNSYGFFSLTPQDAVEDSVTIVVSYIGYEEWRETVAVGFDKHLRIQLTPSPIEMGGVTIVGERPGTIERKTDMSVIEIPIRRLKVVPALLGEVDIIKAIQLLPGVQSGMEGSSGLYVRGGAPDQNLILLDGAPVYNASHLFGFYSVFNADAVKSIKLTKGGFPARFGGRLSSVLEISMNEGNNQELRGLVSMGLISSRFMLEGPLKRGASSFIITARRTYADIVVRPFLKEHQKGNGYYFTDFNAKVNHTISDRSRLYLSFYGGLDKFYFQSEETYDLETSEEHGDLRWGNVTSTLRWNNLITRRLFNNVTLIYSKYRFRVEAHENSRSPADETLNSYLLKYFSGIEDWSLCSDFDFLPNPSHTIRFGGSATTHEFSPGAAHFKTSGMEISELDTLVAPTQEQNAIEANLYFEDNVRFTDGFSVNTGIHSSLFSTGGTRYISVQPRLSTRIMIAGWALKSSYASMSQNIHLLSNAGIGLPTDLWVPATPRVKPQKSRQLAFGLARSLFDCGYELSLEAYHKTMDNLIEYKEGAGFLGFDTDWQNKIETGSGRSYGIELFLEKKFGRLTGWLGYTISRTDRLFEGLNAGERFPYRYDRRHDISLVGNYRLSEGTELSGTWVYGTGNAVSLPIATYPSLRLDGYYTEDIEYYPARNNIRMKAYHRLDLGIRFAKSNSERERALTIGIYNLYSRKNPFFYFFSTDSAGNPVVKQASLFPIIPAISYTYGF
jgi:hypothetical protein